jgi:hypothetical protein
MTLMDVWPMVVWEVAYSENEKKLANDLGRYIGCSFGMVQLAIGVKIKCNCNGKGVKKVTCAFQEADYAKAFATLEASGLPAVNCLLRCDDDADEADEQVVPAATKFFCILKIGSEYVKYTVPEQVVYKGSAFILWNTSQFTNIHVGSVDYS